MENAIQQKSAGKRRWLYLAVGTVLLLLLGLIYAWSVFIAPLESEFGWSRAETSVTFTLSMVLFCVGGMGAGIACRKLPAWVMLCASAVLMFAGFMAASRITSLGGIYIAYGVCVGLGVGLAYNTVISMVSQWFPDKRGLASGVLLMGFGMGGMLLGTAATTMMAAVGWRTSFVIFSIAFALVLLVAALVLRAPSLEQFRALAQSVQVVTTSASDLTPGEMLKRGAFWMYFIWGVLLSGAGLIVVGHSAAAAADMGLAGTAAALVAGIVSIANGVGRVLAGLLMDRVGLRPSMWLVVLCAVLAPACLILSAVTGMIAFLCAGFVFTGLFYGGLATANPNFISAYFGQTHFAINFSLTTTTLLVAPFCGSYLAGALRSATGSYLSSFAVMLGFGLASGAILLLLKKPVKEQNN